MKSIRRKCNPMINLSKFISNKKILSRVVVLDTTKFVVNFFFNSKCVHYYTLKNSTAHVQ